MQNLSQKYSSRCRPNLVVFTLAEQKVLDFTEKNNFLFENSSSFYPFYKFQLSCTIKMILSAFVNTADKLLDKVIRP